MINRQIDRTMKGRALRDLHAFACAFTTKGYSQLDRSEPKHTPGKGSA